MITFLAVSPSLDVTFLVRSLVVGGISRPYSTHSVAGGKAVNAARVAARLGAEVHLVAALGGPTGDRVATLLRDADTSIDLDVVMVDRETRMCLSVAADDAESLTELYEPIADITDWSPVVDAIDSVPAGEWLVLCGSIPGGIELSTLAARFAAAVERGVFVAIDTHGPGLVAMLTIRPALVKINRFEAADAVLAEQVDVGDLSDTAAASLPTAVDLAVALSDRTGGIVIITDGVAGSVAVSPDLEQPLVAYPDLRVGRYPVGSGDSVLGALIAALDAGEPLRVAFARGAAAGSANAAIPGAAQFSLTDFEDARRRIVVEPSSW
jgi:fructose-1-phosphate kinase PfkB-like protein